MSIEYRPWREDDDLRLLEVWPDAPSAPAQALRARLGADDAAGFSRTLVAVDHGVPVGAGVVYESPWHPRRLWAYVEVAPDRQREGIGRELVARVRDLAEHAPSGVTALRTRVTPGSVGEKFAQAEGLIPAMRSRVVRVAAGALPEPALGQTADGSWVRSVEDLATGSVELTRAVWQFYRSVHGWDPVADIGIGAVNRQLLSDTAGAYGALVLREGVPGSEMPARISAFAVSYRPFDPQDPEDRAPRFEAADVLLGYVPGTRADEGSTTDPSAENADAGPAVEALLALLVRDHPVEIEVDDSMGPLVVIADNLLQAGVAHVVTETITMVDDRE